jgi:SAM-dependent methyltransferase
MIGRIAPTPRRIIEIGASNGYRLAAVASLLGAHCVAIDPSQEAISDGRTRYPQVEFRRGSLEHLPVAAGETFDLVILHFVLHWIDRSALLGCVAEIDRAVSDGGSLLIGDFLPDSPTRVDYHHLPGRNIYTYKQDYAAIFLASHLYAEEGRLLFRHGASVATDETIPEQERCAVTTLRKAVLHRPHALPSSERS